jgi:hypothetical protein
MYVLLLCFIQNYSKCKQLRSIQPHTLNKSSSSEPGDGSPDRTPSSGPRPLPEFTARSYRPKEFERTLGKLTVSSIAAPRKTIDVPQSSEGSNKDVGVGTDSYAKKRQALAVIEKVSSRHQHIRAAIGVHSCQGTVG